MIYFYIFIILVTGVVGVIIAGTDLNPIFTALAATSAWKNGSQNNPCVPKYNGCLVI